MSLNLEAVKNTILELKNQLPGATPGKRDFLERNIRDFLQMLPDDERQAFEAQPPGLGDHLETVFKATGIQRAVKALEAVTGKDCGCVKRKERLNEWGRKIGIGGDSQAQKSPHEAG
jgi:hypothetical protein